MVRRELIGGMVLLGSLLLVACRAGFGAEDLSNAGENESQRHGSEDLRIVTLLPRDAIPAIDNPRFLSIEQADLEYDPDELVLGVDINGEARAYSVPLLSGHEIVNDTVGGSKIAVTW